MTFDNLMKTDLMRYRESCEDFITENLITEILHVVKKGKEAVVVCCQAHPETQCEYLAVKLFREQKFRNFRRDGIYKQGRTWDKRMLRAGEKKTHVAEMNDRILWVETEFNALSTLFDLGLNVPEPFACTDDAVAMAFVGEETEPAPLLKQIEFETPAAARRCFDELLNMVDTMLRNSVVHGDLSAYNILYHNDAPWIIDFPQAVDPHVNLNGYEIFERDIANVLRYFEDYGILYTPLELARSLWEPIYGPVVPMIARM